MSIEQLKAIIENQYRSTCNSFDYDQTSIDNMLAKKLTERNDKDFQDQLNALESFITVGKEE